jgi:hypothetical protein
MIIEVPEWPALSTAKGQPIEVNAVNIFDQDDGECVAYVFDDDGHVHFAIQLGDAVIAAEHVPENEPATSIAFYASIEMWKKAVNKVAWIVAGLKQGNITFPPCDIDDL